MAPLSVQKDNSGNMSLELASLFLKHNLRVLFAATPPLEAMKMLFSTATAEGIGDFKGSEYNCMKIEFIDIRRAYYQAHARRDFFVQLPPEDSAPGMCSKLNKALQGTRDAAQCWEYEYNKFMVDELGFARGICSPCMF